MCNVEFFGLKMAQKKTYQSSMVEQVFMSLLAIIVHNHSNNKTRGVYDDDLSGVFISPCRQSN